jgi:hypothetical protein
MNAATYCAAIVGRSADWRPEQFVWKNCALLLAPGSSSLIDETSSTKYRKKRRRLKQVALFQKKKASGNMHAIGPLFGERLYLSSD